MLIMKKCNKLQENSTLCEIAGCCNKAEQVKEGKFLCNNHLPKDVIKLASFIPEEKSNNV